VPRCLGLLKASPHAVADCNSLCTPSPLPSPTSLLNAKAPIFGTFWNGYRIRPPETQLPKPIPTWTGLAAAPNRSCPLCDPAGLDSEFIFGCSAARVLLGSRAGPVVLPPQDADLLASRPHPRSPQPPRTTEPPHLGAVPQYRYGEPPPVMHCIEACPSGSIMGFASSRSVTPSGPRSD